MVIVDTNVISEVMRPRPLPSVLTWLNAQDSNRLFITTVTLAEIGYGLRILPEGQRRWQLHSRFEQFIAQAFEERVLDFTASAARAYAEIMGCRKEIGAPCAYRMGKLRASPMPTGLLLPPETSRTSRIVALN